MIKCRVCKNKKNELAFISTNYHGRHLFGKGKFKIYKCLDCQSLFLGNIKINNAYYKKNYPQSYTITPGLIDKIYSYFNKKYFDNYFRKYRKVSILDIGCGNGSFLNSLSDRFQKYGTDIKKQTDKFPVIMGDFNTIKFNRNFDCITLNHVLEHLPEPQITLNKVHSLLKDKGKIFISVPNALSLGQKIGKKYGFHLDSPRHLFVPSQLGVEILLKKCGYTDIKSINRYFDFPLDLFWSVRHSHWKYIIYPLYPLFKLFSSESLLFIANK